MCCLREKSTQITKSCVTETVQLNTSKSNGNCCENVLKNVHISANSYLLYSRVTAAAFVLSLHLHLPQLLKMALLLLHWSTTLKDSLWLDFFPDLSHKNSSYDWSSSPFIPPIYFCLIFIHLLKCQLISSNSSSSYLTFI